MTDLIERLRDIAEHHDLYAPSQAADEIERLRLIEAAAKNLVAQKGRYNTEVAYKILEEALK